MCKGKTEFFIPISWLTFSLQKLTQKTDPILIGNIFLQSEDDIP